MWFQALLPEASCVGFLFCDLIPCDCGFSLSLEDLSASLGNSNWPSLSALSVSQKCWRDVLPHNVKLRSKRQGNTNYAVIGLDWGRKSCFFSYLTFGLNQKLFTISEKTRSSWFRSLTQICSSIFARKVNQRGRNRWTGQDQESWIEGEAGPQRKAKWSCLMSKLQEKHFSYCIRNYSWEYASICVWND